MHSERRIGRKLAGEDEEICRGCERSIPPGEVHYDIEGEGIKCQKCARPHHKLDLDTSVDEEVWKAFPVDGSRRFGIDWSGKPDMRHDRMFKEPIFVGAMSMISEKDVLRLEEGLDGIAIEGFEAPEELRAADLVGPGGLTDDAMLRSYVDQFLEITLETDVEFRAVGIHKASAEVSKEAHDAETLYDGVSERLAEFVVGSGARFQRVAFDVEEWERMLRNEATMERSLLELLLRRGDAADAYDGGGYLYLESVDSRGCRLVQLADLVAFSCRVSATGRLLSRLPTPRISSNQLSKLKIADLFFDALGDRLVVDEIYFPADGVTLSSRDDADAYGLLEESIRAQSVIDDQF